MLASSRRSAGYSLLELLIVTAVVGILASLAIPHSNPEVQSQLVSAAELVAGDLAYARELAVDNASQYLLTFDLTNNRYSLSYSGSNNALATLPVIPFRSSLDTSTQHVVALASLPHVGPAVSLLDVQATGTTTTRITTLEFGPLGQTTQANPTVIWLTAGVGGSQRYISLSINPVTGLATVGSFTGTAPYIPGQSGAPNAGS